MTDINQQEHIVIKKLFWTWTNPKAYIGYDAKDKPYNIISLVNVRQSPESYRWKWEVRLHPYSLIDRSVPGNREYNENTWKTELIHSKKHFMLDLDLIETN